VVDHADQLVPVEHAHRVFGVEHRAGGVADDPVGGHRRAVQRLAGPRRPHHPTQCQHVRTRHLGDEVAHVVVCGHADHLGGRPDLHDLPVAHDQDPVAELERLLQVVRNEDHRLADLFVQPDDLVLHVPADQRVERGERLVEHQQLRVGRQGPGQPDPLLHAAGELVGVGVLVPGEADQVDHLLGPAAPGRLVLAAHLQRVGHVVDHLAVRQQTEVLEHHGHVVPAQLAQLDVVGPGDLLAVHHDTPGGGLDEPGEQPDQGGLARAGQAHHHEHLAGRHLERDVLDGHHAAGLGLQVLAGQVRIRCADDLVGPVSEDLPQAVHRQRGLMRGRCHRGPPRLGTR